MKIKSLYLLILSIGFLAASSCKEDDTIEGPELVDLFGDFKVIEPLRASIKSANFANGDVVVYKTKLFWKTPKVW